MSGAKAASAAAAWQRRRSSERPAESGMKQRSCGIGSSGVAGIAGRTSVPRACKGEEPPETGDEVLEGDEKSVRL